MDQVELQEQGVSQITAEQQESSKLVPVAESIRYRKRAQMAEKQVEILAGQLEEEKSNSRRITDELSNVKVERELIQKLAAAGSIDLETAVLIAKAKICDSDKADLDVVIEELKKEKHHLFSSGESAAAAGKTAPAKERVAGNQTTLERAARRAAESGSRTDLQEYLKLRRKFV